MTIIHSIPVEHKGIDSKKKSIDTSEYLNLPDLQFFLWCQQQYKVNKGIYNTIDNWFYEYGIDQIHHRRIYILAFLEFTREEGIDQKKYLKFGKGGLTRKLYQFTKNTETGGYMI